MGKIKTPGKPLTQVIHVRVDEFIARRLNTRAKRHGITESNLIRNLIKMYLDQSGGMAV